MPDINEWVLAYDDVSLTFGTLESGLPFTKQVDIADVTPRTNDIAHPNSDGMVMGIDRLGGLSLTFEVGAVRDQPYPGEKWTRPLNQLSEFQKAWRADSLRRVPGRYAVLTNVARDRMVYGRPRKVAPTLERVRQGNAGMVAQFATNSPDFYSATEKVASLSATIPPSAGFRTPIVPPFSTVGSSTEVAPTVNAGDLPAWPVLELVGPGSEFSVELLNLNNEVQWSLLYPGSLAYDQTLRIDTRPWSRSATINGNPANGTIFGTALEDCTIPVGSFWVRFKVNSRYGTASANLRWRDTYASL